MSLEARAARRDGLVEEETAHEVEDEEAEGDADEEADEIGVDAGDRRDRRDVAPGPGDSYALPRVPEAQLERHQPRAPHRKPWV